MALSFELPPPVGVFSPPATTPAAQRLVQQLPTGGTWLLRGEPNEFAMLGWFRGRTIFVGALTVPAITLTVRLEDIWERLPRETRAFDYRCAIARDAHELDAPEAQAALMVREQIEHVAPDARIFLDLRAGGGFLLEFTPEDGK